MRDEAADGVARADGLVVVFRADSGRDLGTGHVVRCLTLAQELRRQGASVQFVCRELPGHAIDRVESAGIPVRRLHAGAGTEGDALETRAVLDAVGADWVVVDHYALGEAWERAARPTDGRVLAIDDLPERAHECDILLDQNWYGPGDGDRHAGRVPARCRQLLGPAYALLQPEYAEHARGRRARSGPVRRLLVFFGGSDLTDETAKVLDAVAAPPLDALAVDVVLGGNHPDPAAIEARVSARTTTTLHRDLPSLAGLMAAADLAIGAGGATTWERLCLGLPSLVVTLAANQEPTTRALAEAGFVRWIGRSSETTAASYRQALAEMVAAPPGVPPLGDGLGTRRVAAAMAEARRAE